MFVCVCVLGWRAEWRVKAEKGRRKRGVEVGHMQSQTNSLSFIVFPWAHTPAEEIRCQFKAGRLANLQVSCYKTWGSPQSTEDIFPPCLSFQIP